MEWLQEIEQRLNAAIAESQSGGETLAQSDFVILAPFDIAKLIAAVRVATSGLHRLAEIRPEGFIHDVPDVVLDVCGYVKDEAQEALAQLQSGEFPEEDE